MCDQRIHATPDSTFKEPHPPFSTLGDDLPTTAARTSDSCFLIMLTYLSRAGLVRNGTSSFLRIAIFLKITSGSNFFRQLTPMCQQTRQTVALQMLWEFHHQCKYIRRFPKDLSAVTGKSLSSTTSLEDTWKTADAVALSKLSVCPICLDGSTLGQIYVSILQNGIKNYICREILLLRQTTQASGFPTQLSTFRTMAISTEMLRSELQTLPFA